VHLVDMRFAGADTLVTARALRALVDRERPDLVLLGRSTVDGGTAQVAPQLAELAGYAQPTHATAIKRDGPWLAVSREIEQGSQQWRVAMPAIISVEDGPIPTEHTAATNGDAVPITELDADALGGDSTGYGIRGSATYVQKVLDVPFRRAHEPIFEPAALASRIEALASDAIRPDGAAAIAPKNGTARELWVVADARRRPTSGQHRGDRGRARRRHTARGIGRGGHPLPGSRHLA
jgi:electron transfer flavoprotein alpha subunit